MTDKRRHGAGSLYQTKHGWMVRHQRTVNGERTRHVDGPYPTRREAELATASRTSPETASLHDGVTTESWLLQWLAQQFDAVAGDRNSARYEQYRKHIRRVVPYLPHRLRLDATKRSDLDALFNRLSQQGLAPKYQRNIRSTLGLAFEAAVDDEIIASNPVDKVTVARTEKDPLEILSVEDWKSFCAHLSTLPHNRYAIGCLIAATTGMRAGEVCGVTWNHLDLNAGTITIGQQVVRRRNPSRVEVVPYLKTSRSRRKVSIPALLVDALRNHRATLQVPSISDHVVTNNAGELATPQGLLKWVQYHAYPNAGVPDVGLHGLRHTVASHLLSDGVDVVKVSYQLGHSNPNFTLSTYAHVTEAAMPEIGESLGRLLGESADANPPSETGT